MNENIRSVIEAVYQGRKTVDEAVLELKTMPFQDIGFAKVDLHRKMRQGVGRSYMAKEKPLIRS